MDGGEKVIVITGAICYTSHLNRTTQELKIPKIELQQTEIHCASELGCY